LQSIWESISYLNKNEVEEYSRKLKQLPPEVLFEVLLNSEKLNLKLNLEFEEEINRGRSLGLINDKEKLA
jgi:hypothetical protein